MVTVGPLPVEPQSGHSKGSRCATSGGRRRMEGRRWAVGGLAVRSRFFPVVFSRKSSTASSRPVTGCGERSTLRSGLPTVFSVPRLARRSSLDSKKNKSLAFFQKPWLYLAIPPHCRGALRAIVTTRGAGRRWPLRCRSVGRPARTNGSLRT